MIMMRLDFMSTTTLDSSDDHPRSHPLNWVNLEVDACCFVPSWAVLALKMKSCESFGHKKLGEEKYLYISTIPTLWYVRIAVAATYLLTYSMYLLQSQNLRSTKFGART